MRIIFSSLLLFSLTLPLFQVNNNSTDTAIDYLKDKLLYGNWGMIANQVINISEKVLQKENASERTFISRVKQNIITGYGIGFSSIGAAIVSWNNYRFNRFELVPIIPLFMIFTILLQVFFHRYFYRKRNALLSIINMLLSLSVFGNCIGHENYSGHLVGLLIFIVIQITYMVYFYWFPYKNIILENNESQTS
jgi:O-antigen/teichoic acid export membrane protein